MKHLVLDLATCPLPQASDFLEPASAPANYKDQAKIDDYIKSANEAALAKAGLDVDLGRIAMIGLWSWDATGPQVLTCKDEAEEAVALRMVAAILKKHNPVLVGYNSLKFDWPYLMRRARYLGVDLKPINIDKFRSPHIDLMERLSYRGALQYRSLGFWVKRMGWTDLTKTLTGAQEALAPQNGQWAELEQSVLHDVVATKRLAEWMGELVDLRSEREQETEVA